jgi:hypothetical protein
MSTQTIAKPKCLTDLRYQDNVLHLAADQSAQNEAEIWFLNNGLIEAPEDTKPWNSGVKVTLLFQESEADTDEEVLRSELRQVYECYTDLGSTDYLYIVK